MNLLFYTSYGMAIVNVYSLYLCNNPIKILWSVGLFTSIINHSLEEGKYGKQFFRTLDRNVMRAGFTIYHLYQVEYLYLLQISCLCYIVSKITKNVYFHMMSHFFVAVFHHKMLVTLNQIKLI